MVIWTHAGPDFACLSSYVLAPRGQIERWHIHTLWGMLWQPDNCLQIIVGVFHESLIFWSTWHALCKWNMLCLYVFLHPFLCCLAVELHGFLWCTVIFMVVRCPFIGSSTWDLTGWKGGAHSLLAVTALLAVSETGGKNIIHCCGLLTCHLCPPEIMWV